MSLLLAFDFGGTKLTAAAVATTDLDGERPFWRTHERAYSPPAADARYDLDTMTDLGQTIANGEPIAAIGVSFGGPVDAQSGIVRLSHHVSGWEQTPLRQRFSDRFGVPVALDNDANAAALGEHRFGAGRGHSQLMYITVSTGVGGGLILNNEIWRGQAGMAGEIGHTVAAAAGPVCLCGKRGCVERLASGPYMARDAQALLRQQPTRGQLLRQAWERAGGLVTGKMVAETAALGDDIALEVLERGAWGLGIGIGNVANLLNLQRFILGGGVTKSGAHWWQIVGETARATAMPEVQFDIVPAELGDDAPLWGAIVLAQQALAR